MALRALTGTNCVPPRIASTTSPAVSAIMISLVPKYFLPFSLGKRNCSNKSYRAPVSLLILRWPNQSSQIMIADNKGTYQ
ncbi:hypothetical protein D3C72_859470 [compost metagenome]